MEKQKKYTDIIDKQIKALEEVQETSLVVSEKVSVARAILDLSVVANRL